MQKRLAMALALRSPFVEDAVKPCLALHAILEVGGTRVSGACLHRVAEVAENGTAFAARVRCEKRTDLAAQRPRLHHALVTGDAHSH